MRRTRLADVRLEEVRRSRRVMRLGSRRRHVADFVGAQTRLFEKRRVVKLVTLSSRLWEKRKVAVVEVWREVGRLRLRIERQDGIGAGARRGLAEA